MKIERLPDWQNRLVAYMNGIRLMSFDEDLMHCATFVSGAIEAMTGVDPSPKRTRGRSIAAGLAVLKSMGYEDHVDFTAKKLEEYPSPTMGMPGDVAVLEGDGGWALGIIQGDYVYAFNERGMMTVPRQYAVRAFKV